MNTTLATINIPAGLYSFRTDTVDTSKDQELKFRWRVNPDLTPRERKLVWHVLNKYLPNRTTPSTSKGKK